MKFFSILALSMTKIAHLMHCIHELSLQAFTVAMAHVHASREEENVAFDPNKLTQTQKEELIARVESRTELQEGCMVWQGMARKHGYPQMKLGAHIAKVTGSPNKAYNPARILYSVHHNEILFKYSNNRLSHLCHNKLCCSIEHLTLEPLAINIQRNTCMREGTCVGHGNQPNCKIHA